jgi:hypothetical protein
VLEADPQERARRVHHHPGRPGRSPHARDRADHARGPARPAPRRQGIGREAHRALGTGEYGDRLVAHLSGKEYKFPSWYCDAKIDGARYKLVFLVDRHAIGYDGLASYRTKIRDEGGREVSPQGLFGAIYAANTVEITDPAPFKAMKLSGYDDYSIYHVYEELKELADPGTLRVVSILGQHKMVARSGGKEIYVAVEHSAQYGYSFHVCGPDSDTRTCAPPGYPFKTVLE